jgi:hypothetical protein
VTLFDPPLMNVFCILLKSEVENYPKPSLPLVVAPWFYIPRFGPALLESSELPLIEVPYLVFPLFVFVIYSNSPLSKIALILSNCFSFEINLINSYSNSL